MHTHGMHDDILAVYSSEEIVEMVAALESITTSMYGKPSNPNFKFPFRLINCCPQ